MKILAIEQKSEAWFQARLGKVTASKVSNIITPTGKKSTSAQNYMDELLAEYIAGKPIDVMEPTAWMAHGNEFEAEARSAYSFITDNEVKEVGFCMDDNETMGISPDGLIDPDGGLEIKCVKGSTLISYYRKGFPLTYKPQVMMSLYVTGRKWWDFMAYHQNLRPYIERINRDDEYIELMGKFLVEFNEKLAKAKDDLKEWRV